MNTRFPAWLAAKQFSLLEKVSLSFINKKFNISETQVYEEFVNEIIFSILATLVTYFWQSFGRILEMHFYRINRPYPEVIAQSF